MSDKISPPNKKIPRGDGVKQGSANKTLTTPNDTEGRYFGGGSVPASLFKGK